MPDAAAGDLDSLREDGTADALHELPDTRVGDTPGDGLADLGGDVEPDLPSGLDVVDALEVEPPVTDWLLISADTLFAGQGGQQAVVQPGQGWVTELNLPSSGAALAFELVAVDPGGASSCALFNAALWFPEDAGGEVWSDAPSYVAPELFPVQGFEVPQTLFFSFPPPVPQGPVRIGLVLAEPCPGQPPTPVLVTDGSGLPGSWLWILSLAGPPWIPTVDVGLEGRWALRLLLDPTSAAP